MTRSSLSGFRSVDDRPPGFGRGWIVCGAAVLVLAYLWAYAAGPAAPGNDPRFPLGWWGWFDQSKYVESAMALAAGNLDPGRHWYPLGYALLGEPFADWLPAGHLYLVADLCCLVATYLGFVLFARVAGVGPVAGVLLFLVGTITNPAVLSVWAEPWNTTLSAALIWWLLALTALLLDPGADRYLARRRLGMAAIGALLAGLVVSRPTDLLLVGCWGVFVVLVSLLRRRRVGDDPLWLGLGMALVLLPFADLYLHIYGPHPSQYMINSRQLGFRLDGLWWKAYTLLVEPEPWYPDGIGLLAAMPWLAAGFAGIVALPALRPDARAPLALLALLIVPYVVLFLSYVDLLPSGLWRYNNIHYFKWTFPGFALLGFVALRDLVLGSRRRQIGAAFVVVLALLCVHVLPARTGARDPAWLVQVPGSTPGFDPSYFGRMTIRDGHGIERNVLDFRLLPDSAGMRLLALHQPFTGPVTILDDNPQVRRAPVPAIRWRLQPGIGWPCWLPPYQCEWAAPGP